MVPPPTKYVYNIIISEYHFAVYMKCKDCNLEMYEDVFHIYSCECGNAYHEDYGWA
jgi:hypothetical protein